MSQVMLAELWPSSNSVCSQWNLQRRIDHPVHVSEVEVSLMLNCNHAWKFAPPHGGFLNNGHCTD